MDWVERSDGTIEWDENVTSADDTDLRDDETYLGRNALVVSHERKVDLSEPINSATIEFYSEKNKKGPSATISGNTITGDNSKFGVMLEGLYLAKFRGRSSKGPGDLSIIINNGGRVSTVRGNPNNDLGDFLTEVFLHIGNKNHARLVGWDKKGNRVYTSKGCLTTVCGTGSSAEHDRFMNKVGTDFKGFLYLRSKP